AELLSGEWTFLLRTMMGELLFPSIEVLDSLRSKTPLDFRLCMAPGPLAVLPWELVSLPDGSEEMLTDLCYSFARTTPQRVADREAVKWIQIAAARLLGRDILVDGIDGPMTRAAITELQHRFQLDPHGGLDESTLERIKSELYRARNQSLRILL